MHRAIHRSLVAFFAALLLLGAVHAQPQAQQGSVDPELGTAPTIESVQAQLDAAQAATDIDEAAKTRVVDFYQRALEQLRLADQNEAQRADYERLAAEAPARLTAIREALSAAPQAPTTLSEDERKNTPLPTLEQRLSEVRAALQAARDESDSMQAEAARRTERRTAIPDLLARARRAVEDAETQFRAPAVEGESPRATEARRVYQRARLRALNTEIRMLEAETASYDARRDLLAARRDQAQRRVAETEAQANAWQEVVRLKREAEAEAQQQAAIEQARKARREHPVLQNYAARNQLLSLELAGDAQALGVNQKVTNATDELRRTREELTDLQEKFRQLQRRLDVAGLNKATGKILRKQYSELPRASTIRSRGELVRERAEETATRLIETEDERDQLKDVATEKAALIADLTRQGVEIDSYLDDFMTTLVTARRDVLDQLVNGYSNLSNELLSLDVATRQYASLIEDARAFIGERILWVPSVNIENTLDWPEAMDGVRWLFSPAGWRGAFVVARANLLETVARIALCVFAVLLSGIVAVRAKRRLMSLGERTRRIATDTMEITWLAILLTALAAIPLPVVLFALWWLLDAVSGFSAQASAFSRGFLTAGYVFLPLNFLRQLMRGQGLADAHFRWRDAARNTVCRTLLWAAPVLTASFAVVDVIRTMSPPDDIETDVMDATIGRAALSVGLIALTVAAIRLTSPNRSAVSGFVHDNPDGWLARTRLLWRPIATLTPIVILVFAWFGYVYTAMRLSTLYLQSFWIVLGLTLLHGIMQRWLFLARRRLAIQEAKRRREAATEQPGSSPKESGKSIEEERINLPAISLRTTELFRTTIAALVLLGLLSVWSDTLPALRFLDRIEVWPTVRFIGEDEAAARPAAPPTDLTSPAQNDRSAPSGENAVALPGQSLLGASPSNAASEGSTARLTISLADIGLTLIIVVVTVVSMRQIPAFIEIVILQRLPMDAGARYALSTVIRYVIVLVGGLAAFKSIGVSWQSVQWLAAALTFGLAFGLQEIFANFISGLIILAERPVRVGDTVTVNGVTGTVARMRMRATTITDWDRKELVIPNKTFITSDVINWTLSDPIMRVIVKVGVSYSSDVEKVSSLLLQIAKDCKFVLSDPEPRALFLGFGESTLDHELRVFIDNIDNFVAVRHELHTQILNRFREHGIEIAFPQRDLHIRSVDPLENVIPIARRDIDKHRAAPGDPGSDR